ncbi:MAG: LytTR family DNA-binding domain-containing protein [Saprospiraceae bacterium]|jgi:two-component system LytT family response regulator|nr:response regulator transcription factor [Lewinellaceae bacterium]
MEQALKALIIDDEKKAREVLQLQLEYHIPEITHIRKAAGADEASDLLAHYRPDIVFLDIKMPQKDGFAWLKSLDTYDFQVVFTTAYDQYAIQAIRFSAFDYLLKPVDAEELRNTMDRLLHSTESRQRTFDHLFFNTAQTDPKKYRLTIATTEGTHFLDPADIVRCAADGNYTHFFLHDGKRVVASRPLGHFIELLEGCAFIRCHKSHLVNAGFIAQYSEAGLTLTDGTVVEVSRRRRSDVKKNLEELILTSGENDKMHG